MLNISNRVFFFIATTYLILREFRELILRETTFFMNSLYNCNMGSIFLHLPNYACSIDLKSQAREIFKAVKEVSRTKKRMFC